MKWKTAFKIALLHPFRMVWAFFDSDHHKIVSREGQRRLQKLALIKMMKHDEELGLYDIDKQTTMAKFRKKPVVIEAVQFTRMNWEAVQLFTEGKAHTLTIEKRIDGKCTCIIPTLEGQHIATEGDWIIKGVQGEFYPCKPDIFEQTYESY
jgi:hypothetical protein